MMTPQIHITAPQDAETLWLVRDRLRFMGDLAGTQLSVVEVEVPPGSGTPPHRHASFEIFRVLSGEITFGLFEESPPRQVRAGAGTVVTVPSNLGYNYANMSDAPASMLVVVEHSMRDFFRDLGSAQAPPAGPPSEAEIASVMAACARHGIDMLAGKP
jgi:quercetin dioxygenase-like cupin family protein